MNKDFAKHQKIIDQFRGKVLAKDFEAKFAIATAHIPKTDRFLLKMEVKRLANPCTRLIDLRGHVEGECDSYEHDGRTHFLDEVAIKSFKENIDAYGSYTFGVYEAVNNTENNFRVIYQKEKQNLSEPIIRDGGPKVQGKVQYPAKFYHFGQYHNRREERMNFAIPLEVTLDNGDKVEATSSDLSVSGCKFRFNEPQKVANGQVLQISFTGLEQEFSFGDEASFSYEVCNLQHEDQIQMVGLKRIYTKERDGFKQFLTGFIQGNKRRYKINLDNTISALQSRSLEQFSLPKCAALPIFIQQNKETYQPKYVLTTNNNQKIAQYWQDERHFSTLNLLVNPERIQRLINATKLGRSLIVYSFVHENQGKQFFYTADDKQLSDDNDFKAQFIGFAVSKSTLAITELKLVDVDACDAHTRFTIANQLPKRLSYLDLPLSGKEQQEIATLPYLVLATDLTTPEVEDEYSRLTYENINTSKVKRFGHKRNSVKANIDYLGINYRNQRLETRFKYITPVVVSAESVNWTGESIDFSVSGMKIRLEKSATLKKGEIVYLSFPRLQKITSAFELKKLPYEIVKLNKDKTILNVRVYVEKHQHAGRAFFKALIEKNQSKLSPDDYDMVSPGLSKGLRNIYAKNTPFASLFVQTSGSRYKVEAVAGGEKSKLFTHLKSLSDRPNHYNLYPLINHLQVTNSLKPMLKSLQTSDDVMTSLLFIAIKDSDESIEARVNTKLARDFTSVKLRKMFISNAMKNGRFYCIQMKLSRADEPDMEYLNPELSYIGSYAIHRGKQIEQDIWSMVGVIQCFDVTQETLTRYQLIPDSAATQKIAG